MIKAKILIVEDEGLVAAEIKTRLESSGYTVPAIAYTGQQAVDMTAKMRPDLVLMDIGLKGDIDGIEAAVQIRTLFDIPVVYLTAYSDDETLMRAKMSEPFGFIIKPFEELNLHTSIEIAIYKHRMERKLRESERKFRYLADETADVVTVIVDGKFFWINSASADILGYSREELIGQDLQAILSTEDVMKITRSLKDWLSGKRTPSYYEIKARHKDDRIIDVSVSAKEIVFENKEAVQLVMKDITERKRAEEALRESEKKYRQLIENIQEGIWVIDEDYNIIFVNSIMVGILGYSTNEMLGKSLFSYMDEAGAERCKYNMERRKRGIIEQQDFEFSRKDGRPIQVDLKISPVTSEEKDFAGAIAIVTDITERKRTHDSLRESEARLRGIIENAQAGYFYIDRNGLYEHVNYAWLRMHGFTAIDEVIGQHFSLTQVEEDLDKAKEYLKRLLRGESITSVEFTRRCKDGSVGYHIFSATPIKMGGKIIGLEGFMIDTTQLKKAIEEK